MDSTQVTSSSLAHERARAGRSSRWRLRLGIRWIGVVGLALICAALLLNALLRPTPEHLAQMVLYLAISGAVSIALGEAALRLADVTHRGSVRLKLAIPALLTAVVIALNILLVAHQMFISIVDSQMAISFLAFGVAVALVISKSIATGITASVSSIEGSARRIAAGDYGFRIAEDDPRGTVELSRLAHWFNQMAANVENAFEQQRYAEADRRRVIAAVSHDLRTPLTSVRAMVEAIDDGVVTDPETIQRYHHAMRGELRHLTVLLDDLFMLSRLESGALTLHREPLVLDDMISDALEMTTTVAARRAIALCGHVDEDVPPMAVDARQMYRVLSNLLHNALQYTPRGGAVLIHASRLEEGNGPPLALVRVIDTGYGIEPADLPHIFERTYRGEPSRKRDMPGDDDAADAGAGLGLAIVKGIVVAHGGNVWAESPTPEETRALLTARQPNHRSDLPGTVICVALPIAQHDR